MAAPEHQSPISHNPTEEEIYVKRRNHLLAQLEKADEIENVIERTSKREIVLEELDALESDTE